MTGSTQAVASAVSQAVATGSGHALASSLAEVGI